MQFLGQDDGFRFAGSEECEKAHDRRPVLRRLDTHKGQPPHGNRRESRSWLLEFEQDGCGDNDLFEQLRSRSKRRRWLRAWIGDVSLTTTVKG